CCRWCKRGWLLGRAMLGSAAQRKVGGSRRRLVGGGVVDLPADDVVFGGELFVVELSDLGSSGGFGAGPASGLDGEGDGLADVDVDRPGSFSHLETLASLVGGFAAEHAVAFLVRLGVVRPFEAVGADGTGVADCLCSGVAGVAE